MNNSLANQQIFGREGVLNALATMVVAWLMSTIAHQTNADGKLIDFVWKCSADPSVCRMHRKFTAVAFRTQCSSCECFLLKRDS